LPGSRAPYSLSRSARCRAAENPRNPSPIRSSSVVGSHLREAGTLTAAASFFGGIRIAFPCRADRMITFASRFHGSVFGPGSQIRRPNRRRTSDTDTGSVSRSGDSLANLVLVGRGTRRLPHVNRRVPVAGRDPLTVRAECDTVDVLAAGLQSADLLTRLDVP
jgi:hypothetical protein